jgi:hypothetical protein
MVKKNHKNAGAMSIIKYLAILFFAFINESKNARYKVVDTI